MPAGRMGILSEATKVEFQLIMIEFQPFFICNKVDTAVNFAVILTSLLYLNISSEYNLALYCFYFVI
jgi:hypothetical protein